MKGLSLVDLYTEQGSPRLISNIVLRNESLPDALQDSLPDLLPDAVSGSSPSIPSGALSVDQPDSLPYEIVGFENHGGRTYIGDNMPFGKVLYGHGNNGKDACEGVLYRNVIGTYLHGPLLPKNPHVCDLLLQRALSRKYGVSLTDFPALDDRFHALIVYLKGRETAHFIKILLADVFTPLMSVLRAGKRHFSIKAS